jgi:hypothetical protein
MNPFDHVQITITPLMDDPQYASCPRCRKYTREGIHNMDCLCNRCADALEYIKKKDDKR